MDDAEKKALCDLYQSMKEVTLELRKRSASTEKVLVRDMVIPANTWNGDSGNRGYYETEPIQNEGYCCGRVLIDTAFDAAVTAGLTVDLYYKSEKIGEVIKVPSCLQVTGGSSPSLDLAFLSGFHLVVVNHDPVHAVTIKNLRILLWGIK